PSCTASTWWRGRRSFAMKNGTATPSSSKNFFSLATRCWPYTKVETKVETHHGLAQRLDLRERHRHALPLEQLLLPRPPVLAVHEGRDAVRDRDGFRSLRPRRRPPGGGDGRGAGGCQEASAGPRHARSSLNCGRMRRSGGLRQAQSTPRAQRLSTATY